MESSLGRRWSLAGSTFITAFFCMVFVRVDGPLALKASTVGISLSATVRQKSCHKGVVIECVLDNVGDSVRVDT